jgi:hypothetical protein
LWDILCKSNPLLFPKGLNLIILDITSEDITDNVKILCPKQTYSSELLDFQKEILLLIKNDENYTAAIEGGYESMMDTSPEPLDVPLKPIYQFGKKDLIVYDDQNAYTIVSSKHKGADMYVDIPLPKKLDDYSIGNMCDYKNAFRDNIELSQELETNFTNTPQKTYEKMLDERASLDTYLTDVCKYEKVSLTMPANK